MGKLQFRRGSKSALPTADSGEPLLATDSGQLFIGTPTGNVEAQLKGSATDYTIYVATSALGGIPSASGATGKAIRTATATATTANKLVDSTASFASATHLNKPVYNSTDDTWAKITAVDSTTQCSLSADIMVSGEGYVISNAFDNIPEAFNVADTGYNANITLRVSAGTFSNVITLIGKTAGAAKTLIIQGSTTGTTTVSGETSIYQKISLKNITFTKRVFEYFGADVDWTTCVTSGDDGFLLLKSTSVANVFRTSSVIIFENDPAVYTSISSTVTKGYTIYVATSTYGGDDAVGDGLKITQGTATATTANKLVDSTANFNSTDHLYKTLYNSTDDTWAKITAIDSTTQVSISADIMASGEAYVIANAVATIQRGVDLIPGTFNSNTTVKISGETYNEVVTILGKLPSATYNINVVGTKAAVSDSGTMTASGSDADTYYMDDTGKAWGVNAYIGYLLNANGQVRLIESNTATRARILGYYSPAPTGAYSIYLPATTIKTLTLGTAQGSITATHISVGYNSGSLNVGILAALTMTNCLVEGALDGIVRMNGILNLYATRIKTTGGRTYIQETPGSRLTSLYSWFKDASLSQNSLSVSVSCFAYLIYGTAISGAANHGVYSAENAVVRFHWTSTVGERCRIYSNGAWGIYVEKGAQANNCANNYYNANVSGTFTGTAGSYGYAS